MNYEYPSAGYFHVSSAGVEWQYVIASFPQRAKTRVAVAPDTIAAERDCGLQQ